MQSTVMWKTFIMIVSLLIILGCNVESGKKVQKSSLSEGFGLDRQEAIEGLVQVLVRYNSGIPVEGLNLKMYFPPLAPINYKNQEMRDKFKKLRKKAKEINEKIDSYWSERKFVIIIVVTSDLHLPKEYICDGFKIKIVNTYERQERVYHNADMYDLIFEYDALLSNPMVVVFVSDYKTLGPNRFSAQLAMDYGIPQTNVWSDIILVRTKQWEVKSSKVVGRS